MAAELRLIRRAARRVLAGIAVALVPAVWAGLLVLVVVSGRLGIDGVTYVHAARHLLAGEPFYGAYQLSGPYLLGQAAWGGGFVYPPSAALLLVPPAIAGMESLTAVFLVAWLALGVLSSRVARESGFSPSGAACVGALVMLSWPAVEALALENVNLLVADGLLVAWLSPSWSGYLAVAGAALKLFPGGVLVWTWRKRGRLAGPAIVAVGIVAVTSVSAGAGSWVDFALAMVNGQSSSAFLVPAPAQVLRHVVGHGPATLVACLLAGIALIASWRIEDDHTSFAVLGWALILAAPDWWPHYLLIPAVAALPLLSRWYLRDPDVVLRMLRRLFAAPKEPERASTGAA